MKSLETLGTRILKNESKIWQFFLETLDMRIFKK